MELDRDRVVNTLNRLVELELSGAVRFTQYSLMVFGHARIPIMSWMREQAQQSLAHAVEAGEEVTALGGKVSLGIGELVGTHHDSVDQMLEEMLIHEQHGVALWQELLQLTEGRSVSLEELARQMLRSEQLDIAEMEKMLRKRGDAWHRVAGVGRRDLSFHRRLGRGELQVVGATRSGWGRSPGRSSAATARSSTAWAPAGFGIFMVQTTSIAVNTRKAATAKARSAP